MDEPFSTREEIAHSITHGIGLLLSIPALVLLVVFAAMRGTAWHVVSCSLFGATMVLLYASSTLYHAFPPSSAKRFFGFMDHSAIYFLIAGTYTPFMLVSIRGPLGWTLAGIVWGLAILGTTLEFVSRGQRRRLALAAYLVMGWLIVGAIAPLLRAVPTSGVVLLGAGGFCYTFGVVFFVRRSLPYNHAIWHLFVLGGTICHFFSVLLYVIPRG